MPRRLIHMRFRRVFLVIALTSTVFLAACASNKETEGARFEAGADVLEELQNPTTGASYSFDPLLPFDANSTRVRSEFSPYR